MMTFYLRINLKTQITYTRHVFSVLYTVCLIVSTYSILFGVQRYRKVTIRFGLIL